MPPPEPNAKPEARGDLEIPDARERILEAGARAIGEKSFHGCGLSEILQAAGVPRGSFYYYFPSKEEFGVALVERARDEDLARLGPILRDPSKAPLERLRALFEEGRRHCLEDGARRECLVRKLALEHARLSPPMRAAVREAYGRVAALIAETLRAGQEAGKVAPEHDADRLASILMMLWEGATQRMQIDDSIQPVDSMIEFLFHPRFLFAPLPRT
jgi:TetR/AcrR family transcriptional repressor of nem operon